MIRRFRLVPILLVAIILVLGIALTFSLITDSAGADRPQVGRVEFQNDDIQLAGNLWIPAGKGPFPAIVIVHGAGKISTRDYDYISFFFVHQGFVTLTYDKRGVGESGGSYSRVSVENSQAVLKDLADDVLAGIDFLKANDMVDSNRIGLFGISQAGWIAPLVASQSSDVAFIALYSGPVCTVGQEIYYSQMTGDDPGGKADGNSLELVSNMTRDYQGEHGFDPILSLEAINISGLWMFGSQDRSIPVALSLENLDALITQKGKDFSYIIYPNADHNLMDTDTEQFFPAMSDSVDWILEKVGD